MDLKDSYHPNVDKGFILSSFSSDNCDRKIIDRNT